MNKNLTTFLLWVFVIFYAREQKPPTGNPGDFKVKTCLHSIGYAEFCFDATA